MLTIEDLAMEIVGEITDEHDAEVGDAIVSEGNDTWTMEGDVHLDEVRRIIGHDLPRVDVETVAGMLIAELGALPAEGDTVTIDLPIDPSELISDEPVMYRLEVDVLRIERHVPTEVRVRLVKVPMAEEEQ